MSTRTSPTSITGTRIGGEDVEGHIPAGPRAYIWAVVVDRLVPGMDTCRSRILTATVVIVTSTR